VNIYGLSEVIGPGVSCECVEARSGLHVNEDHFLPEVVDPESGEPLADGEQGVLVFTTLSKEAMPLVRYWTGDITSLDRSECPCGRTLARMSPIAGRADDMLVVRGVNVYPTQVEAVLLELDELTPSYRIVVDRPGTLDEATVEIEVGEGVAAESGLRERAERLLAQTIGCSIAVVLKPPGALPRSEGGKLQRVDDRRRMR
jgi:phenylacetate-CoA ligase